jgi:hypothetical protein
MIETARRVTKVAALSEEAKEARNRRIFDMRMARNTQEEIVEACDCSRDDVRGAKEIKWANLAKLPNSPNPTQRPHPTRGTARRRSTIFGNSKTRREAQGTSTTAK